VSVRTTARHRADAPVSTPLTTVSAALADKVPSTTAARSGFVLAVSTGLVAGVGLPAQATTGPRADEPTTASLQLPQLAPEAALADQAVAAPKTARVQFERTAMTPSVKKGADDGSTGAAARTVAAVSRSLARAAAQQQVAIEARATAQRDQQTRVSRDSERTAPLAPLDGSRGAKVVAIASRYFGVPYRFGGTTPRGFDCSGLVLYVYAQLGIDLPRTAAQQYGATRRISRSEAQPGDLVFFFGGGGISHVGIYVGDNMMIAAPRSGTVVRKQPIYSSNVGFGRV
jgi:cell wall-associated NlpC family hydrolase